MMEPIRAIDGNALRDLMGTSFNKISPLIPLTILLFIVAVFISFTGGCSFHFKTISSQVQQMSPLQGLKRIFGTKD